MDRLQAVAANDPEKLQITRHAVRRMRLYRVSQDDLAQVLARPEPVTPSRRRPDRIEVVGSTLEAGALWS